MVIQVRFGTAQTGIGYQFYDADGTLLDSRVTADIASLPETGSYAANPTVPATAVGVYWDTDTDEAQEDLRDAIALAALDTDLTALTAAVAAIDSALAAVDTVVDSTIAAIGTPVALDGGAATIAGMLTKMSDDDDGGTFDAELHSLAANADLVLAVPTAAEIDTYLVGEHGSGSWRTTVAVSTTPAAAAAASSPDTIKLGETYFFTVAALDAAGDEITMDGTWGATCRFTRNRVDGTAVSTPTMTIADGVASGSIDSSEKEWDPGTYWWDVCLTDPDGYPHWTTPIELRIDKRNAPLT